MRNDAGFTLLEALLALAILAMVILQLLGTRTEALIDATEARNWRLAKEIANEKLSELKAGAREVPPEPTRIEVDGFEDPDGNPIFSYQIIIGEERIMDHEAALAGQLDMETGSDRAQRLGWQRERDQRRLARQKGMALDSYRERMLEEEYEDDDEIPSETELEDVMVIVYFPNVSGGDGALESHYSIKEKVSTLAIQGLTPEQAEAMASSRGVEYDARAGALPTSGAGTGNHQGNTDSGENGR